MNYKNIVIILLMAAIFLPSRLAKAQTETPPTEAPLPTGVVTGTIVNLSQDGKIPENVELMVHAWDQTAELGMIHGTSQPNGTFRIEKVPFETDAEYLVMAVYKDVTYYSKSAVLDSGDTLNIDVPIYESTTDLSQVQVDQLHVLFDEAVDGLEVKEIYVFSNLGDRTVKEAAKLDDGSYATFKVPLPAEADYIFFKPDDDKERFVKYPGGIADKAPLMPGAQTGQFMVSYLLPYKGQTKFTYTASLNIEQVNLLIPAEKGLTLSGSGLGTPETTSMQEGGATFKIYSYSKLQAGKTISVSVSGTSGIGNTSDSFTSPPLRVGVTVGLAFLGLSMIATGIWWTYKTKDNESDDDESLLENHVTDDMLELILSIAQLDESYERGEILAEDYQEKRASLMKQAKTRMVEESREQI